MKRALSSGMLRKRKRSSLCLVIDDVELVPGTLAGSGTNLVQNGDFEAFRDALPPRDYFTDEIRRQLSGVFGEQEFFSGGLTIRATVDPEMQKAAAAALRKGLEQYDRNAGVWRGTGKVLPVEELGSEAAWRAALAKVEVPRDVESLLRQLYQNLEQVELEPTDVRYVPFEDHLESFGPDVIAELGRDIAWSTPGSTYFLSGLRGSGKSTQLLRLQANLQSQGFAVVRLNAEDYLNIRLPINVTEFLFFLVGGIADQVETSGWLPDAGSRIWSRLRDWVQALPRRIEMQPEAKLSTGADLGFLQGEVALKASLRADESFVAQLRRFLGRSRLCDRRSVTRLLADARLAHHARASVSRVATLLARSAGELAGLDAGDEGLAWLAQAQAEQLPQPGPTALGPGPGSHRIGQPDEGVTDG